MATLYEPYLGEVDAYECTEAGPDRYPDLVLKINTQEVVAARGELSDGYVMLLHIGGTLKEAYGGTRIVGKDVIWIIKERKD